MTFKVGDKIRRVSGSNETTPIGYEGVIREVRRDPGDDLEYRFDGGAWGYAATQGEERWELVIPLGPVRTETVQRIEPGVYGPLKVGVEISIPDCDRPDEPPQREVEAYLTRPALSASDWRELARVALEIAEYLDAQ